jgi:predicted transcriptional regulator
MAMGGQREEGRDDNPRTSCAFNIRTDVKLAERIQQEAERRGESSSFVFREAVRQYLARVDKLLKEDDPD